MFVTVIARQISDIFGTQRIESHHTLDASPTALAREHGNPEFPFPIQNPETKLTKWIKNSVERVADEELRDCYKGSTVTNTHSISGNQPMSKQVVTLLWSDVMQYNAFILCI